MVRKRIIALVVAMIVFDVVAVLVVMLGGPTGTADAAVKTLFWKGAYGVDAAVRSDRNLSTIHARPEGSASVQCVACHGSMETTTPASASSSADASESAAASSSVSIDVHFHMSLEVENFACTDCHRTNRVWKVARTGVGSSATTSTQMLRINRFFCFKCHGSFGAYVKRGTMKAEWKEQDCTMCHKGKLAPRHEQPFLNQVLSSKECPSCHGDNLFPWPTRHYDPAWVTEHGSDAQDVSTCTVCHSTEQFCKDCHLIKPPSHESLWRAQHAAAYNNRPSRCGPCHVSKFCNDTCHFVDHTKDWGKSHGRTVQEETPDYCMTCHYLGFCVRCHDSSNRTVKTIILQSTTPTSTGGK